MWCADCIESFLDRIKASRQPPVINRQQAMAASTMPNSIPVAAGRRLLADS